MQKSFTKNKDKENFSPSSHLPSKQEINKILLKFSFFILKISQNEEISFSDWIKAIILYSKSLYYNEKFDQAIQSLIYLLDIFAITPHENIKFLSEINKDNKISITNVFVNFDLALNFYSKHHVYKKCEDIFLDNYVKKENMILFDNLETLIENDGDQKNKIEEENIFTLKIFEENELEKDFSRSFENNIKNVNADNLNEDEIITSENKIENFLDPDPELYPPLEINTIRNLNLNLDILENFKNENLEKSLSSSSDKPKKSCSNLIYDPNFIDLSNEFNNLINDHNDTDRKVSSFGENIKVPDLNIKTIAKLEEYLDNNIDNIGVKQENFTFITIISNPIILYEIGKLCAKTKSKLELGLMCLNDFNLILKFQNNYKLTHYHEKKKIKAKFWKGLIHTLLNNFK